MLKTGPVVGQHFRIRWEETSQTSEIGNHMQAFLLGCEIPSQPPEVLVLMRPKVTSMLADWKHAQPELSPSGKTCVQPRPPSMTRVAGGRCPRRGGRRSGASACFADGVSFIISRLFAGGESYRGSPRSCARACGRRCRSGTQSAAETRQTGPSGGLPAPIATA